ncbi:predicted ATPase involved in cell division [Clostridium sp. CAG:793]|nr:predicted ATPase involved in cell division [Clostridium sp. CAG:793]
MINKIIIGRKGRTIMIEFRNVSKTYDTGTEAIHNANFKIDKGEFCFLVGSSGSGKSTLIKMILKEEEPSSGNIIINGKDTTFLKPSRVPYLRRSMGIVFQDFRLLPDKTVYENVAFAMYVVKATPKHIRRQVPMVLSLVGLSNKAKVYPNELSGGEQQRVALARAIVNNPSMLIADEPTGNLDPNTAWDIMELLNDINLRGTTVVVATHAKDIVDKMNKRVIRIDHGNIVRDEKGGYDGEI